MVLLTGAPVGGSTPGVLLALGAAALTILSLTVSRRLATESGGLDGLALNVAGAACLSLPLAIRATLATPGATDLALAGAVAGLAIAIPYPLEYIAIRRVSLRTFGILLSLDPALAALAGGLLLGQRHGLAGAIGIAFVVFASAGAMASRRDARLG